MFATLLLIFCGLQFGTAISQSQPQNGLHSASLTSPRPTRSSHISQLVAQPSHRSSLMSGSNNLTEQTIRSELLYSPKSKTPSLVNPPTTSNPNNDVKVFGPLSTPFPQPLQHPYKPAFYTSHPNYALLYTPVYADIPPATAVPFSSKTTHYTEPTTPPTPKPSTWFTLPKVTVKRTNFPPTTPPLLYNPYPKPPVPIIPAYTSRPVTGTNGLYYPWTLMRPPVPAPIWPSLTKPTAQPPVVQIVNRRANSPSYVPQPPLSNWHYRSEKMWAPARPAVQVIGTPSPIDPKYKLAVVSNYENFNETAGTFGFDIDLENGLTVQAHGYKRDGKQILEGSFSLFSNQGEPVRISFVANDEDESLSKNSTSTSTIINVVPTSPKIEIEDFTVTQIDETTTAF